MNICIAHPFSNARSSGNSVTARRWGQILESLNCNVQITSELPQAEFDVLIAMNPAKLCKLAQAYLTISPRTKLIFAITGTDLHGSEANRNLSVSALEQAVRIICINPLSKQLLPDSLKSRCSVILQSSKTHQMPVDTKVTRNAVIVAGHLREEKDPLLILDALNLLDMNSKLTVRHFGAALDESFRKQATTASQGPLPYTWFGEVDPQKLHQEMSEAKALILSSRVEGAPAVVSEAIACGLPIIGTDIDGIRGLLGESYPALFPVGDSSALARLLTRLEHDEQWRLSLIEHIVGLQSLFSYEAEVESFRELLSTCAS